MLFLCLFIFNVLFHIGAAYKRVEVVIPVSIFIFHLIGSPLFDMSLFNAAVILSAFPLSFQCVLSELHLCLAILLST